MTRNKRHFLRFTPFIRNWLPHKHDSSSLHGILQYAVGSNWTCCGHCTLSITRLLFLFWSRPSCISGMSAGNKIKQAMLPGILKGLFPTVLCLVYFCFFTQIWSIVFDRQFFRLRWAFSNSNEQKHANGVWRLENITPRNKNIRYFAYFDILIMKCYGYFALKGFCL